MLTHLLLWLADLNKYGLVSHLFFLDEVCEIVVAEQLLGYAWKKLIT